MVKCPFCAFENPEDGKFCTNCGKTVAPPPATAAAPDVPPRFCTDCGGKIAADSKFCTACGKPFGAEGVTAPAGGAAAPPALDYLAALDTRLAQNGFEKLEPPAVLGLDRFLRRKRFELAKVGQITTICGVKALPEAATAAYLKDFSKAVFDFATSKKGILARNAFQQLLVYPVLIAPAIDAGLEAFLDSYWNKHWMAYEYPVVVSLGTRQLLLHKSTPVWGAAFHASFKKEAESLFAV
jgi:hypothetical protein